MKIIDLSKPLMDGVTIQCKIPEKLPVYEGFECEEYRFEFRSHFGCYYETDAHLFRGGTMTCDVPVKELFLPAVISRLSKDKTGPIEPVDIQKGLGEPVRRGDALIVDTQGNQKCFFSRRSGEWMAENGVSLLGSSLERYDTGFVNPTGVFVPLFEAKIPIIAEIQRLDEITESRAFLLVMPMPVEKVCTVPCRVFALTGDPNEISWLVNHIRPDLGTI